MSYCSQCGANVEPGDIFRAEELPFCSEKHYKDFAHERSVTAEAKKAEKAVVKSDEQEKRTVSAAKTAPRQRKRRS